MDLVQKRQGKDLAKLSYPETDSLTQLEHGEKIGLGNRKYILRDMGRKASDAKHKLKFYKKAHTLIP